MTSARDGAKGGRKSARATGRKPWTRDEIADLFDMRDEGGLEFHDIAERLGRTPQSCSDRYAAERVRKRIVRPRNKGLRAIPSNEAEIDAAARQRARGLQDLTGSVLGDPPPGFSARDRLRSDHQ